MYCAIGPMLIGVSLNSGRCVSVVLIDLLHARYERNFKLR